VSRNSLRAPLIFFGVILQIRPLRTIVLSDAKKFFLLMRFESLHMTRRVPKQKLNVHGSEKINGYRFLRCQKWLSSVGLFFGV